MSREIMFRSWNENEKRMYRVVGLLWGRDDHDVLDELFLVDEINTLRHVDGNDTIHNNYQLTQYTGLKDLGAHQIYEGDIVYDYEHKLKLIVKWRDGKGRHFGAQVGWILDDGYYVLELKSLAESNECECAKVDVLGNIYEHPDILKSVGSFGYNPLTEEPPK